MYYLNMASSFSIIPCFILIIIIFNSAFNIIIHAPRINLVHIQLVIFQIPFSQLSTILFTISPPTLPFCLEERFPLSVLSQFCNPISDATSVFNLFKPSFASGTKKSEAKRSQEDKTRVQLLGSQNDMATIRLPTNASILS